MPVSTFGLVAALWLGMAPAATPAQSETVETRFDRIHLRNGNFLDGRIVKSSPAEIVLKLKVGEMTVRRDLIERIEQISMRSLTEEKRGGPPPPPPPPRGVTPPPTRPDPVASLPAETDLQKRVLGILNELRQSSLESRPAIVEKFASLGEEGALFLATQLPNLDAISMPYAAAFLGRKKEPRTAPILAGHLKHPKPAVRAVSASALGSFGPAAPVSDLLPLLDDADSIVRGSALGAIRQVAPREAFGPVARLAADPAGEIRANAVEALFEIARKHEVERDLAPTLVPLLDRTAGPARATVAGAIGRTGDKQAWSAITPLLRDDSAEVRAAAAQGLETLGAPEAGAAILAAIVGEREKRPRVRLAAAAEKLKVVEAGKAMIPWLEDPDVEVQTAALTALRRLTGQSIGPDPKAWQAYWESAKPK